MVNVASRRLVAPPVVVAATLGLAAGCWAVAAWLALSLVVPLLADRYVTVLLTDIACFALFAASLHFIMGPAGMVSFGHAAYFGLGAYAGALMFKKAGLPMELALVLAPFVAEAKGRGKGVALVPIERLLRRRLVLVAQVAGVR